jgi:acetoin utilization deacetylase AcuC-like enzyme
VIRAHGAEPMNTGIFLPYFDGPRLRDFPAALAGILDRENVRFYDGVYRSAVGDSYMRSVPDALLFRVHSRAMVERVKRTGYLEAALYSAGGTVQAADEIRRGRIDNAFVFTGHGDHHAGRNFFGGMCYLNGAALAIAYLRENGWTRFTIIDTDSHHADGTRDIFAEDAGVVHICFCDRSHRDNRGNIDIPVPRIKEDDDFLCLFAQSLAAAFRDFVPEIIFWEFGYDGTRGEYGDRGVTQDCHGEIARIVKREADRLCEGRLIAILCGGSSRAVATYAIPRIIRVLAGLADRT